MTWVFSLSAECGRRESLAFAFSEYFQEKLITLSNGYPYRCDTNLHQDSENNWWCVVYVNSFETLSSEHDPTLLTKIGIHLYQDLRYAPLFNYAIVGVEVDEFRTYNELINDKSDEPIPGLVMRESIYQQLRSEVIYYPFREGYVWQVYEGES